GRGVAAQALEDRRAVMEGMDADMDLGVVPGDELPVHPDLFRLREGHGWRTPPRQSSVQTARDRSRDSRTPRRDCQCDSRAKCLRREGLAGQQARLVDEDAEL